MAVSIKKACLPYLALEGGVQYQTEGESLGTYMFGIVHYTPKDRKDASQQKLRVLALIVLWWKS